MSTLILAAAAVLFARFGQGDVRALLVGFLLASHALLSSITVMVDALLSMSRSTAKKDDDDAVTTEDEFAPPNKWLRFLQQSVVLPRETLNLVPFICTLLLAITPSKQIDAEMIALA